jgi:hypothetical protein
MSHGGHLCASCCLVAQLSWLVVVQHTMTRVTWLGALKHIITLDQIDTMTYIHVKMYVCVPSQLCRSS